MFILIPLLPGMMHVVFTAQYIVLAKVEKVFAINCSDVVAFAQVSTK